MICGLSQSQVCKSSVERTLLHVHDCVKLGNNGYSTPDAPFSRCPLAISERPLVHQHPYSMRRVSHYARGTINIETSVVIGGVVHGDASDLTAWSSRLLAGPAVPCSVDMPSLLSSRVGFLSSRDKIALARQASTSDVVRRAPLNGIVLAETPVLRRNRGICGTRAASTHG